MIYAWLSVLASGVLVAGFLLQGRPPGALAWTGAGYPALVATLGLCATFTALSYAAKWRGGEPEGWLDAGPGPRALRRLLLAPYSLLALVVLWFEHRLSGERFADEVAPSLWVGRLPMPWDRDAVTGLGVHAVLNMCLEFGDLARLTSVPLGYHQVGVLDTTAPSVERLGRAVAWCEERLRAGEAVLVHCAHGHGRSALVAAATLLATGQAADPEEALERARAARPGVKLSEHQRAVLREFHGRQRTRV